MGSALALPFVLLLWAARRMCYVVQRPSIAVVGSVFYFVFGVGGFVLLSKTVYLSPFCAFLLTGLGSLMGALLLLHRLGVLAIEDSAAQLPWRVILREDWTYGRWLVASTLLYSAATQSQTFLTGGLLGLGAAGVLRAMQLPALAMSQVVTATGLLVLPAMSYDFGRNRIDLLRQKAALVSQGLAIFGLAVAGVLAILAPRIERLMFAGRYAGDARLMPVLALVPVFAGLATGYSMALRAVQQPKFDLMTNAVSAPVGLIATLCFMSIWGISGAALGMIASFVLYAGSFLWHFQRWTGDSQRLKERSS
jgi:O-antigen/teichoic acid export membrane protein